MADDALDPDPGEVLDSGRDRRPPRRLTVAAAAVLLVAAGAVGLVDQRTRHAEERAVATCSARAAAAVRDAWSPIVSMSAYVRPVLDGDARPPLRRDMERLVRGVAREAPPTVAAARASCEDVGILGVHGSLSRRRDACVDALARHEGFLADLAAGRVAVTEPWPSMLVGC